GGPTVSCVEPMMPAWVAEIVVVPTAAAFARPAAEIVAADVDDAHTTVPVMSAVEPSLNVPVAVYCWVRPFASVMLAGVTAIDTRLGADGTVTRRYSIRWAAFAVTNL